MPESKRQNERLIVLLLLGAVAMNYPLFALFNKPVFWLGIPLLYFYLFTCWVLFICVMALVLRKKGQAKSQAKHPQSPKLD